MKNIKQYYKALGKLVYAVAIADGAIQPEEVEKLHNTVLNELVSHEESSDSSGMNQAFYVDFEFEESAKAKLSIEEAVKSFEDFVRENQELHDTDLIDRSLKLLKKVSNAYTDKKEKLIIERVEHELKASQFIVN